MYNNPFMYGGAGSGMNFGTNPYYSPYMQTPQVQQAQQTMQNPPQQQVQSQQQQPSVATNKIYVNGLDDVRGKHQSTNSDIFYFDNDNPPILYEKIVDGTGHFEVKTFSLAENKPIESQNTLDTNNLSNYVLKAELEPLQAEIKALSDKLTKLDIKTKINNLDKPKQDASN